jgi:hypothetical protein
MKQSEQQGSISVKSVCELHDRLHLSQFFATLPISYPVRTKALFHDENGSRSVYPAFHLQAGAQLYVHIYFYVPKTDLDA